MLTERGAFDFHLLGLSSNAEVVDKNRKKECRQQRSRMDIEIAFR